MRCKWQYLWGMVFILIYNFSYSRVPDYMRIILEEVSDLNRGTVVLENTSWALLYLLLTCFFMYHMRNFIIGSSREVEYAFRKSIFEKLLSLPVEFYRKQQTGDLISRIINDMNDIRTMVGPGIMYIPNSLARMLFFVPVMYGISANLMISIGVLILMLIVLILIIMPKLRPFYKNIQEARAKINNDAWQMASGITTIKTNSIEPQQLSTFEKQNDQYIKANLRLALVEQFTWPLFVVVFGMSGVIILWIGGSEVIAGEITKEELLQFNIMLGVLTFPIFSLGWVMSLLQQGISALQRLSRILSEPSVKSKAKQKIKKQPHTIKVNDLTIYDDEKHEVLKKINLTIPPGKIIGITGKTGSGKTLLLECILGLVKIHKGLVTIDDIDVSKIDPESLFSEIAFVPQESFLFSDLLKNNIGLEEAGNIDLRRVVYSAEVSDLDKDVRNFNKKYDEEVGERGITLSGGQKQRATLSRAVYKRAASLLILDDSLSSVDSETEKNITKNLKKIDRKKSVIIVSHKISLLKIADRIHYLNDGKIAESGTHKQLLAKRGLYAAAAKLQELERSIAQAK